MSDYYIPLSVLAGSLNLTRVPFIGEALADEFRRAAQNIGVRRWQESWNDTHASIRGTGVWGRGDLAKDFGGFTLAFGNPTGDTAEFEFELSVDRSSLMSTAVALGGFGDLSTLDDKLTFAFQADGPPLDFRLVLRGLGARIRFHRDYVRKGKPILAGDGTTIGIGPFSTDETVDDTADVLVFPSTIVIDSRRGFDLQLDDDELVQVPPLRIMKDGTALFGLLVRNLKLDLSETRSPGEVLAHGYDERWQGVLFDELTFFGLDAVFPTLPSQVNPRVPGDGLIVSATRWFIGTDGVSGALKLAVESGPDPASPEPTRESIFRGLSVEVELDRGNLVKFGGEVTLHTSRLGNEVASLGPDGDLAIGFTIRSNPDGGWFYEFVLRTPRPDDPKNDFGLLTLGDDVADLFPFLLLVITASTGAPDSVNLALAIVHFFTVVRFFDFKTVTLDNLRIRRRTEVIERVVAGEPPEKRELRWFDFVLDVKLKIALDIPASALVLLPDIKTKPDQPLSLLLHGFTISWSDNFDDFTAAELGDRTRFGASLDPAAGLSLELGDETVVENSPLMLTQAGIGRWERGLWFELGFKVSANDVDLALSVMPSLTRLWFLTSGDLDHVSVEGASFSLLIPKTIYARGEWQGGDVSRITGRALVLGWGASLLDYKDPKNWVFNFGFGMREQALPPPPEPKRVTSRLLSFDFECASGLPLPLLGGMSLYGISGLWASHARPALGGSTPSQWLTQRPPQYQVDIEKWEAAEGESGWGAGVVLGASVDHGRPWNLKAGFVMLKPGPVLMLFGSANFVTKRPGVKDTEPAAVKFDATLDLARHEFLFGLRYEKKWPDATGRTLKLSVPTELFINEQGWHLYAGRDKPAAQHVTAEFLAAYTVSGYLMFDTATIGNLAETGVDVPGFAVAAGLRFAYEGGRKGSHYKLVYYLKAAADVAVGLSEPRLLLVRAQLAGGLVAKAWGIGFEFELSAAFLWVRPTPDHLHGELKVTLDLPWPIPNLHLKIDCSRGSDGDGEPITGSLVDGLTLFLRSEHRAVELAPGTPATGVPVDPVFSLAFKYPMRNGVAVPGNFTFSGGNQSTAFIVGGDEAHQRGYVATLDGLRLWKETATGRELVPGAIPALWRPDPLPAAGGRESTRVLELFAFDGIGASRFLGASADYVDWTAQAHTPCPTEPPAPVCYVFDGAPLGPVLQTLDVPAAGDSRVIHVRSVPEDPFSESVRRHRGMVRTPAEVVPTPVPGLMQRTLRLPATNGGSPPVVAGERLELRCERANEAQLLVLRYQGGVVHVRGYLGDALVSEDLIGVRGPIVGEDKFELVTYTLKGPLDRIAIEAAHGAGLRLRQSLVLRVCLLYTTDVDRFLDQQILSLNWSQFWSDLLSQDAATSGALLLEPGARYTLEIESSWAYLREDGSTSAPHPSTDTFSFSTVPADAPPASLRGPESALEPGDYEVRTVPAKGDRGVYTSRPIRLEFPDARTDAVFGAFGQRLVLRLVDEQGDDLFDRLTFLREHATDLPEYQRAWRDHVLGLPCTDPAIGSLWSQGAAHFQSVLAPNRRYQGSLVTLPGSVTDLSSVTDWDAWPVVHRFDFETSRYASFAAHLAAHSVFDELCNADVTLDPLDAELGPRLASGRLVDDEALEAALTTHLALHERPPARTPEIVRIWLRDPSDPSQVSLAALLFDGPEPFIRADTDVVVTDASSQVAATALVAQQSDARTLVLFRSGSGFGHRPPGDLTLTLVSHFIGEDGLPAEETAQMSLAVPATPSTLAPEFAP